MTVFGVQIGTVAEMEVPEAFYRRKISINALSQPAIVFLQISLVAVKADFVTFLRMLRP